MCAGSTVLVGNALLAHPVLGALYAVPVGLIALATVQKVALDALVPQVVPRRQPESRLRLAGCRHPRDSAPLPVP